MAAEIRNFAVQIPAGTPIAAPQVTALSMPARIVRSIRWRVPEGPFGQMGFAVGTAGTRIIPFGDNQWIVANDEWEEIPLFGALDSGAWQLIGYNLGTYAHTVYLTFQLDMIGASAPALTAPLAITAPPVTVSVAIVAPATPKPAVVAPLPGQAIYVPPVVAVPAPVVAPVVSAPVVAPAYPGLPADQGVYPDIATAVP